MACFAKGNAEVLLSTEGSGTSLSYTAHANVGGKLAQIGQRLIDGAAKQIADDFFGRFAAVLSAAAAETAAPEPALEREGDTRPALAGAPSAHAQSEAVLRREGVSTEIWVVGLIVVVVILLLLFSVSL